jgi:type II secretory pathway component PulF
LLPGFQETFQHGINPLERASHIPYSTSIVMWFSGGRLAAILAAAAGAAALAVLVIRVSCKPATYWRMIEWLPFVGPMVLWRNVATWARLMGLFLEHEIPTPAALQMAAGGVRDANVAAESRSLATLTANGHGLATSIAADRRLPASLAPLLRWGEDAGALPAALRTAGDMFENRVRIRAGLLRVVLPPLIFVLVAFGTLAIWNILLAPLIDSIRNLSGDFY